MKKIRTAFLTAALACSMSTGVFAASCPLTEALTSGNSSQLQSMLSNNSTYQNLMNNKTNIAQLGNIDLSSLLSKGGTNCTKDAKTNLNNLATKLNTSVKNNGLNCTSNKGTIGKINTNSPSCTGPTCNDAKGNASCVGNTCDGTDGKSDCNGPSCTITDTKKDNTSCTGASCNDAKGNASCGNTCDGTDGKSDCNGPSCNVTDTKPETPVNNNSGNNNAGNNGGNVVETPSTTPATSESQYVAEVVRLVNVERAKAGLNPVTADAKISAAALVRSKEQIQSFSHTRPNGSSCFTVLAEQGVTYRGAGENIAMGQKTPAAVMQAWMNSEGHRANILNKNFTKIGVGYYVNGGTAYWTQLFTY